MKNYVKNLIDEANKANELINKLVEQFNGELLEIVVPNEDVYNTVGTIHVSYSVFGVTRTLLFHKKDDGSCVLYIDAENRMEETQTLLKDGVDKMFEKFTYGLPDEALSAGSNAVFAGIYLVS